VMTKAQSRNGDSLKGNAGGNGDVAIEGIVFSDELPRTVNLAT